MSIIKQIIVGCFNLFGLDFSLMVEENQVVHFPFYFFIILPVVCHFAIKLWAYMMDNDNDEERVYKRYRDKRTRSERFSKRYKSESSSGSGPITNY